MFISEKETGEKYFNHKKLYDVTKKVIRNLDTVIDANFYPVIEAENSNFRHRPVGLGIQGLADAFINVTLCHLRQKKQKN